MCITVSSMLHTSTPVPEWASYVICNAMDATDKILQIYKKDEI